jgi:uncharacterized protein YjiS (DUF1127 family)
MRQRPHKPRCGLRRKELEDVMATYTQVARSSHDRSWPAHVRTALVAAWRAYWQRRANRAGMTMLQSMDAYTLHDLGIDRSEIEHAVNGQHRERRSRHALRG